MSPVTPDHSNRPRNARGKGVQLRVDLLDATLGLLATTGDPEDVSIRAAAKAAGVSPTAVYAHFADRDALLEAACDRSFERFSAFLVEATQDAADPFDRLRRAGLAYLSYAQNEPGLYRVLFSNPFHLDKDYSDEDSAGRTAFVVLVDMVQACLDAGALAVSGDDAPDATYLAFQVWSWLHGMVDLRITHPGMPWPDAQRMTLDVARTLGLERSGGEAGGDDASDAFVG